MTGQDTDALLELKRKKLNSLLQDMKSVLVAFSGGVDSTFLLKMAADVLKGKVLAVTALSETYPGREYEEACSLVKAMGVRHITVETSELNNPGFAGNPPDRCYYCKKELFSVLKGIAEQEGIAFVLDGTNADDTDDFRPGTKAAQELGVQSPLKEAGLTKKDIRILSKELGLSTWDKPSFACLSSRFPYGEPITVHGLDMVERAETFLRDKGFRQVRVRHHKLLARIEVEEEDIERICSRELREHITAEFKRIGYQYVAIDIQGYRTGSMNEVLIKE